MRRDVRVKLGLIESGVDGSRAGFHEGRSWDQLMSYADELRCSNLV